MTLTKLRQAVVDEANRALANGTFQTYQETRPIPLNAPHPATDCSGAVIYIYKKAGAADPSGFDYDGYGNTDSLFSNCEHLTSYTQAAPADMIDVARGDGTTHVYLVLSVLNNGDLEVFSNGGPGAAKRESLSSVKSYWYDRGYHFVGLRSLPMLDKPVYKWLVVNGRGHQIGRTNHPVSWSRHHSAMFRQYNQVRFMKNN